MNNPAPSVSLMHSIVIYSYIFFFFYHHWSIYFTGFRHLCCTTDDDDHSYYFIHFYIYTYIRRYIYDYYILYCIYIPAARIIILYYYYHLVSSASAVLTYAIRFWRTAPITVNKMTHSIIIIHHRTTIILSDLICTDVFRT